MLLSQVRLTVAIESEVQPRSRAFVPPGSPVRATRWIFCRAVASTEGPGAIVIRHWQPGGITGGVTDRLLDDVLRHEIVAQFERAEDQHEQNRQRRGHFARPPIRREVRSKAD